MKSEKEWMQEALLEANKAFSMGEVPVGALIILEGKCLSRAHNLVEASSIATKHAELIAMERASQQMGDWRLLGATLYTTLEPCTMCLGAAYLARIKKIVYAAPDIRHGACGSWVNLPEQTHPTHTIEIEGGVLEEEAASLLRTFFQQRRKECKNY